jgi:hypothetical protein
LPGGYLASVPQSGCASGGQSHIGTAGREKALAQSITRGTIPRSSKVRRPKLEIRRRRGPRLKTYGLNRRSGGRLRAGRSGGSPSPPTPLPPLWASAVSGETAGADAIRGEGSFKIRDGRAREDQNGPHPAPSPSGLGEGKRVGRDTFAHRWDKPPLPHPKGCGQVDPRRTSLRLTQHAQITSEET